MFNELTKSVRFHLSERITSPLMGAFLISWCIWNYEFFIYLFSNMSAPEKINYIKQLYPESPEDLFLAKEAEGWAYNSYMNFKRLLFQTKIGHYFVGPLITTLLYIYVYPYPAKLVYKYSRKRQREILDIRRIIEDDTPLTIKESKLIRNGVEKVLKEHSAEVEGFRNDLAKLNEEKESKEKEVRSLNLEIDKLKEHERKIVESLLDFEIKILNLFVSKRQDFSHDELFKELEINVAQGTESLFLLVKKGLVDAFYIENRPSTKMSELVFYISKKGEEAINLLKNDA